ncbi:5784_t:CDS:2, partial [Gigaspora rosea]
MLYLLVQVNKGVKCVIPERIMSIESTSTFFDLFNLTTMGQYDDREVKVSIRREKSEGWKEVDKGLDGDLKMLEVLGFMQVKFCLVFDTNLDTTVSTQNRPDAFDILMNNSRQLLLPQRCTEHNNYHRLYNEIIELFEAQKVGWTCGSHDTLGKEFVNRLTSALWYIDPHISTLRARSYHLPVLFTQLKTYQNGKSYDEFYYTSHHKKRQLSQQRLAHLSSSLEISISQPWASSDRWCQVMPEVLSLIEILKKYSYYLITTTASMNELHYSNESARSPGNNSTMYQVSACEPHQLKDEYTQLDDLLSEKSFYEHVEIQQYLPNDAIDRYKFMKELQLTYPIGIYRIQESEISNNKQDETLKARMLAKIHEELPRYFTRQMRKNVLNKYSYIQKVTPAVLRMLHFDLTGNAAVTSDAVSRDVEERLRLMLTLADPNIIFDLRTNNGFKGTKFDTFWDETGAYFNEQNLLTVNERRRGTVLYMPLTLSVRDLRETIVERLKTVYGDPLPSDIDIPSDEWIRLQFCSTNATTTRAMYYTGRFNVKFKVQGRMLRKHSEDAHYCAALFRYLREFCIQYRQWTCLISADDKHKIPIGEDVAISTGVQNRRSIVAYESTLAATDHDFAKLSLTPSVIFFISIPDNISGSFYNGQVYVSYKDTIFEPSTAIRHSTEFLNALTIQYAYQEMPPILCIQEILNNRTERLKLKNNRFKCYSPASQEHITEVFKPIRLPQNEFCNLSFLPDPIPSKAFQNVYGTKTTEEHRPTYMQSQAKSESIPKYILIAEKIRDYISCKYCQKRRCVYSNKFLTDNKQYDYQQALESFSYSCGAPIFSDDHYLKE